MIAEPIVIIGRLTFEDLAEIHRFRVGVGVRPRVLTLMCAVSGLLLASMIYAGSQNKLDWQAFLIMAFLFYCPWIWLPMRKYTGRGRLRREAAAAREHTATFTNESVSLTGPDQLLRLAWKRLGKIVETRNGMIFVLPPSLVWFYLPWRVLHELDREEILAVAAANGVRIRRAQKDDAR